MNQYKITEVSFETDGDEQVARVLSNAWTGEIISLDLEKPDEDSIMEELLDIISEDSGWPITSLEYEEVVE